MGGRGRYGSGGVTLRPWVDAILCRYPWPEEQQKLFVPTLKFPVPVHLEPFLDKVFPVPMKDDTGDGNADFIPNRTCCSCCRTFAWLALPAHQHVWRCLDSPARGTGADACAGCCCPGWRRRRHKIHPSQASARFGDEPVAPAKSQASKQDVHAAGDDSHVGHAVQATKEIVHMATGQVKRACQCGCLKGFDIRTYVRASSVGVLCGNRLIVGCDVLCAGRLTVVWALLGRAPRDRTRTLPSRRTSPTPSGSWTSAWCSSSWRWRWCRSSRPTRPTT